jgi:peptidoglycan-N-acetylglucosamine deacetylase
MLDRVRRRQFLGRLGLGGASMALGVAGTEGFEALRAAHATPESWASTIAPQPVTGSARTWWSADVAVGHRLALTFDDGPTDQFTAHLLDVLAAAKVQATFFVVGALVDRHPDLVRRARDDGHELGNHSYDHISAALADAGSVREAVLRGSEAIEKVAGRRPRWYRPPRGEVTSASLLAAREAGLDLALWSVNRGDAPYADSAGVQRHLTGAAAPGAVVDLHDGIGRSAWIGLPDSGLITRRRAELSALPQVLPAWREQGYTFETLSRLIPG